MRNKLFLYLFPAFIFFLSTASVNAAASLPVPSGGVYGITFSYPIDKVVPADLNGDGILDFVEKSDIGTSDTDTIKIEARLNNGTQLWSFDTKVNSTLAGKGGYSSNLPVLAWDFNNDGKWEVYFPYYNGGWRHKVVAGLTGAVLVDASSPYDNTGIKQMAAVAFKGNIPRVVMNLDIYNSGKLWMFETYTGSSWSLSPLWVYNRPLGMAHDMIMAADADLNGSDDEIFAGRVVLNSDGKVRYDLGRGNADSGTVGFYSSTYPGLVYVTGDGVSGHITAVRAVDGIQLWDIDVIPIFPTWGHFDIGMPADRDPNIPGAELLAIGKDGVSFLKIRVEDGTILDKGTTSDRWGMAPALLLWNGDNYYDTGPNATCSWCGIGNGDLGGSGSEESWVKNGNTLSIHFNSGTSNVVSRWANRHYRQDIALMASGYGAKYILPLVIDSSGNSGPTPTPSPTATATPIPTPTPTPSSIASASPVPCQNPSPIPSGFSAPCPVFGISPQSLSSTQNLNISITPDASKTVWIYKTLYITEGSTWKSITLPGTIQYTYWLTGNITYTLAPLPLTLSPGVHYLASWDWTWDATNQCYKGPGATACGGGQYRIQTITVQ